MQFVIASIQIIYKLQMHMIFFFAIYKNNRIEVHQKIQKHSLIKHL